MRKKDILELKRRFKKDDCTFTRMCGCYVNSQKNIILNINETFLNLREEEFFKYLEIAKKTLSGTIGNNILELNFHLEKENILSKQQALIKLKKSQLKDATLLNDFYKSIIDSYDYTGNYLILVFHDAYDIITKTTDNSKLDESEEVYEYLLCAICPVTLTKPGLGYLENENRIGARTRDWVVENPNVGFVFPAFIDRSTDVNSVMYYTKNPKDPHPELMEDGLGCDSKQTAVEQKETFHSIILNAIDNDIEKPDELLIEIQENLNSVLDEHEAVNNKDSDPMILTNDTIQNILIESGLPEEVTAKIEKSYTEEFGDTLPVVEHLIDTKALAANAQRKKEKRLKKQVEMLQQQLDESKQDIDLDNVSKVNSPLKSNDLNVDSSQIIDDILEEISAETSESNNTLENNLTGALNIENDDNSNYDVVLKVKPQKVPQIKSQIIDGKKCIIIPIDDNEQANVNGVNTIL